MNVVPAKSGADTLLIDNHYLHSRYDPLKEAESFLDAATRDTSIPEFRIWILLNPGLAYLAGIIKKRQPGHEVYAVYSHSVSLFSQRLTVQFWSPESPDKLSEFLSRVSSRGQKADSVHVLCWKPGADLFPDQTKSILAQIGQELSSLKANAVTERYFSPLWLKNTLHNILGCSFCNLVPSTCGNPVFLLAAGPSLNDHLEVVKKQQSKAFMVALSSSLATLNQHGIKPDIVIQSDGGFWAQSHTRLTPHKALMVSALRSRPWHGLKNQTIMAFGASKLESFLWYLAFGTDLLDLGDQGTVAYQALHFCLSFFAGPVIVHGLDFAKRDLLSHAQPHTFDYFPWESANRLHPGHSFLYETYVSTGARRLHGATIYASDHNLRLFSNNFSGHFVGNPRIFQRGPHETLRFPEWPASSLQQYPEKEALTISPGSKPRTYTGTNPGSAILKGLEQMLLQKAELPEALVDELLPFFGIASSPGTPLQILHDLVKDVLHA